MNKKIGHYVVGAKSFMFKIDAIRESISSGHPVRWNFFDSVFAKVNWLAPNRSNILDVYRQRALQLRETYDYLVLHYSAGSDSHTVLKTFLNNNIKLDEIYVRWPIKASERTPVTNDNSANNILSEWQLTIKPSIEWLRSTYPEIKITVHDWFDDVDNLGKVLTDELVIKKTNLHHINLGAFLKLTSATKFENKNFDSGLKVASIFGIEKPAMCKVGNDVFVYFTDNAIGNAGSIDNKHIEPFFWTPDMPEIVVEQAHMILDYIKVNKKFADLIEVENIRKGLYKDEFEFLAKSLVYPDWNNNTFQVKKAFGLLNEYDSFLLNSAELIPVIDKWKSILYNNLRNLRKTDLHTLNEKTTTLKAFTSPMYKIGTLD
jgi:hypothetical protein